MNNTTSGIYKVLTGFGFEPHSTDAVGHVFRKEVSNICIVVDTDICSITDHRYIDYTSRQNKLVHHHEQVFRFLHEPGNSLEQLRTEIQFFLEEEADPDTIVRYGRNRTEQDIDPTMPESVFEECFTAAFGDAALRAIHREFAYLDCDGIQRFIDYAILGKKQFAIELNGESFHHPVAIGAKKYRSQLFKQNSLMRDGFRVYRWSEVGMRDRDKFIEELRLFLGDPAAFKPVALLKCQRPGRVQTFNLHAHQYEGLRHLAQQRMEGRSTFLMVLPTGTGKTEIYIEDFSRLKKDDPDLSVLILVPTRSLRDQTLSRLIERMPQYQQLIGTELTSGTGRDIIVQTFATMHRHYHRLPQNRFDYIVVDEAHHAVANGLRRVLEHFKPLHLVGVTATPDRVDQKRLEEVFGEYESILTLEEAITTGQVPPVRCYRIKSNVDLSSVRFNGRDYVKSDLQRTLHIPSRDLIIVETLLKYFSGPFRSKQGVVFCVDINHAHRMARLFSSHGISALAVNGRERKGAELAQAEYAGGRVRFLCACDLLTEGWDAPQTSILIMARPTFSQVLYTQQLGRGLRNYPNKEALYVIDVVDNYGAKLQPLSLHSLFGVNTYRPFDDVISPKLGRSQNELVILDGLYEGVRRIEPVDIFNFEKLYGDLLSEEQLARELFVSTGTVKAWEKKGDIQSDARYAFGRGQLLFFKPDQIAAIRTLKGLSEHTEETRKSDFRAFLAEKNYTFSFKIVFLLSFLNLANERGEVPLPDLMALYRQFYRRLLDRRGSNDRKECPYNRPEVLTDEAEMQRSLLRNPFEKFERKRFFYHCADLNYVAMDRLLAEQLDEKDYVSITEQMVQDLKEYYAKLQITLTEDDYAFLLKQKGIKPESGKIIIMPHSRDKKKFKTALPFYPLSIAAGAFRDSEAPSEPDGWIDLRDITARTLDESMFISRIHGHSMEPLIADGSYCIFTRHTAGTRNGRIVLARKLGFHDPDTGASYTLKRYISSKVVDPDSDWRHERIILKSANTDYADIEIEPGEADQFSIIAFYLETIG